MAKKASEARPVLDLQTAVVGSVLAVDSGEIRAAGRALKNFHFKTPAERGLISAAANLPDDLPLIDVSRAIEAAGWKNAAPVLALAPAKATRVRLERRAGEVVFRSGHWQSDPVKMKQATRDWSYQYNRKTAVVPMIPPEIRPASLERHFVLFEADWKDEITTPPDPILLRHVGGSIYGVVGTWDMTETEVVALRIALANVGRERDEE